MSLHFLNAMLLVAMSWIYSASGLQERICIQHMTLYSNVLFTVQAENKPTAEKQKNKKRPSELLQCFQFNGFNLCFSASVDDLRERTSHLYAA